jgi:hypothetical protein
MSRWLLAGTPHADVRTVSVGAVLHIRPITAIWTMPWLRIPAL